MKNFSFSIEEDILTVTINLAADHGPSKSGRSRIVSSTAGNLRLFDASGYRPEKINLTVTREAPGESENEH